MKDQSTLSTTSTETKPNDQSTPAPTKSDEPNPATVPDKYDFKAPDGTTLDTTLIDRASPIFKELGLNQAQAQKLVDLQATFAKDWAKGQSDSANALRETWRAEIAKDPDIGGKLDEVKAVIGRIKDSLSPTERTAFETEMDRTGMGDNPALVKALWRFGKLVGEGTAVTGTAPSVHGQAPNGKTAPRSLASSMYPHLPQ